MVWRVGPVRLALPRMKIIEKLYLLLIRTASNLQSLFLLFVRVYWGWQFHITGRGKIHDPGKVIGLFTDLWIPATALNALFVSWIELIVGLLMCMDSVALLLLVFHSE